MSREHDGRKSWALGTVLLLLSACAHQAEKVPSTAPVPEAPESKAAPQALPGEEVLQEQPALSPLKPFEAPVPHLTVLPNGLKLYVVEKPGASIQALRLVVRRGSVMDPPGLPGVASLSAEMLEAGSAGKSQEQIAAAVDAIGANLSVGAGTESTVISISAMPARLVQMVSLLSDVALRPNLAPAELDKLKERRVAELIAARSQPSFAAGRAWAAAVYGEHPFSRPADGTEASVKRISLAQVKTFLSAFSPKEAAIVAVGGAPEKDVVAALEKAFGGWKARKAKGPGEAEVLAKATLPDSRPRLVLVDFPQRPQSVLQVGQPAVSRASPDYLALRVLNSILGGSFTSRLNQNLREQHGYTYGARSRFAFGMGPGPFIAGASVKTEVTGAALKEMMSELSRAAAQPLSQEELDKGKALLAFELTQALDSTAMAAALLGDIFLYELPLDEYRTYVGRLTALTVADVQQAGQRVLQPGQMTIAVVGDAGKVLPQLEAEEGLALPPPQRRDADGQLLGQAKAGKTTAR